MRNIIIEGKENRFNASSHMNERSSCSGAPLKSRGQGHSRMRDKESDLMDNSADSEDFSFKRLKEMAFSMEKQNKNTFKAPTQLLDQYPKETKSESTSIQHTPPRDSISMRKAPHTICSERVRPSSFIPAQRFNRTNSIEAYPSQISSIRASSTPKTRNNEPIAPPLRISVAKNLLQQTHQHNYTFQRTMSSHKTTKLNPNKFQFKPRKFYREDVEATDSSNASVQKLANWLSDDPFEKKKQILIRKGDQISVKAAAFEERDVLRIQRQNKDQSRMQREKHHFPEGKVSQGKDWLQKAFGESRKEGNEEDTDQGSFVSDKKKIFESSIGRKR